MTGEGMEGVLNALLDELWPSGEPRKAEGGWSPL